MKNKISRTPFLVITSLAGFFLLSCFAVIQRKIMGFAFSPDPKAFIVPFFYGGSIGLLLGLRQLRIWKDEAELRDMVARLQEQSEELQVTDEMLRVQIEEYESNRKLLQESNESLQALFDVSPLAMLISSYSENLIREVNHTFIDNFGYAYGDVVGKSSVGLALWGDNNDREIFQNFLREHEGVLSGFSTEIKTFEGVNRKVLIYSNHIDYKGEKCQLMVYMDVTEQKKMEDILRQTQKMDVIGQLAGGVAHDFNNMLTAITGSAELLTRSVNGDPKSLKFVATIMEAANRSADLTKQLLVFSRKGRQTFLPVCMNEVIKAAIAMLERTIDKNITLESRFVAVNAMVNGDPTLLQNSLLNLGVNARDAMPQGGKITFATANVELDSKFSDSHGFQITPGSFLEISMTDTGKGMTKEVVEHIFEPFFTTKEVGKGTGLGLATVYGTIKQHHGCLNVYSEPGIGTVFKLYLPLTGDKKSTVSEDEAVVCGSGGILLVDDESLIRTSGQALLEDLGYTVYLAQDGEEALEVYAREKEDISLVILDMVMPKMGGKETLLQLKTKYPDLRVIISSGFHQEGSREDLERHGASGFIQKPYRKIELCRAVAMAIGDTSRICGENPEVV